MSLLISYIPSLPSHGLSVHFPLQLSPIFPALPSLPSLKQTHSPFSGKGPTGTQVAGNSNNQMAGIEGPISPSPQSPSVLQQVLRVPCVPGKC